MSITYNDLIARAQQVRDESEIGANTATRVGQLLADIIQWCQDNNADLGNYLLNFTAHLNESGGILNWFQSRIVLLKTMGGAYDDVSVGSLSDGDVYYDSQGNWIREKQGSATINGIHPSKGVYYVNLANKTAYQWDGTTFQVAIESGGGGGASTVTAFEGYEVIESVADLPEQGDPVTGYIVGTHIYAYVGEDGDTADGKYQDMGEVVSAIPTIDPATGKWVIGGETTEYPSRGEKGDNAPVPYVGQNGNWWVGGVDTEVPAQGPAGDINITEGSTPTLTIVKNLNTEDDAQDNIKVLSAGMGKRLGDAVFNRPFVPFDTTAGTLENVYIDINNNTWAKTNAGSYKGKFFDVSAYAAAGCRFKIVPKEVQSQTGTTISKWYQTRFAFLTTNSHTVGDPLSFAGGATESTFVTSKNGLEGVVPADATHLYIFCYNSSYINGTANFPPDLSFSSLMPTNRIERLEDLTDGVDEIKDGWFAVSGEPYQRTLQPGMVAKQQTIGTNGDVYSGQTNAQYASVVPKVPGYPTTANNYTPSASECFCVDDLPNKVLTMKFNQTFESPGRWAVYIAMYQSDLSFTERYPSSDAIYINADNNWTKTFDFKTKPNVKYFKLVLYQQPEGQYSQDASTVTFDAGFMEITQQVPAQESMPDRVEALEMKVTELSGAGVSKFRICSWNVGHWCLGGNYKTDIDTQAKYEEMRGKWRTKLNEISPDVIVMCEYSTVFAELDTNVEAKDAIFGHYAYRAIGSVPSATSWMQTAQYTNIPIRNTSEVVYAQTVQAGRYYQVSDLVLGGVTAKLVITHLDWGNSQNNGDACRAAQMQTLLDAFANESHVIICGDFNNPLASEWDVFANAGYSMANHGYMGDLPTYPATKVNNGETVPPDKAIDNILVKGFAVNKIEIVDDATLTDHCGIMCDLTLID